MSRRRVALRLDHASVAVPNLPAAVEHLNRRFGLRASVTPEAPDRHSRVYLHRSYVEVSSGSGDGWEGTTFFLRFDDPEALRTHLDDAGFAYQFGEYEGVDGTWDDVEIRAGTVPLPTLIRRTAPQEVARDWPPPGLARIHRSGARTLAAVHVEVPSLDRAVEAYRRLLGRGAVSWTHAKGPSAGEHASARLASGEIVLQEGSLGENLGLVLGVSSLAEARRALEGRLEETDDRVAWLDPKESFGLRLGFVEAGGDRRERD